MYTQDHGALTKHREDKKIMRQRSDMMIFVSVFRNTTGGTREDEHMGKDKW